MLKIYKDSSLYNLMSKNNKKKVKNFYAESVAAEYLKIFNEIKK